MTWPSIILPQPNKGGDLPQIAGLGAPQNIMNALIDLKNMNLKPGAGTPSG